MKHTTPLSFLALVLLTLSLNSIDFQYSQYESAIDDELPDKFFRSLRFTRSGIRNFIQDIFNDYRYVECVIPYDFTHLIQFLRQGKEKNQNLLYFESTLRLFSNKLKGSRYVSAYAFSDMLEHFPALFKDQCLICSEQSLFQQAKGAVKEILYDYFLSKFSFFKSNPDNFLEDLSGEIVSHLNTKNTLRSTIEKEELRQTLIRFLEIGLMKIVWSPMDQEFVWDSVKKISHQLTLLMENNVINQDELDDLFKSLLESFCHFLDLTGSELSIEVINKIKEDVAHGKLLLFELEEQEELLETKSKRIYRAISETEAKVFARAQGIITEQIITENMPKQKERGAPALGPLKVNKA